jgi:hypothetical protein
MTNVRRFPPPRSLKRVWYGLLIVLAFPGYLICHLAKYCSFREGWVGPLSQA